MAAAGADSPGSVGSVDSADLQSLLVELNFLPGAATFTSQQQQPQQGNTKRRLLDSGAASPTSSRPQSSPRLDVGARDAILGGNTAAAAAAAKPRRQAPAPALPRQQQQQQQQQRVIQQQEVEVIEILDSSDGSDAESDVDEEWRIAAPSTAQKQRRLVVDSDSSDGCEEVGASSAAAPRGASAQPAVLPPFFAAIPSLAAHLAAPPPPPRQQQQEQQPQRGQQPRAQQQPAPQHGGAAAAPPAQRPRSQQTADPAPPSRTQSGPSSRPLSASAFKKQREELSAQLFQEFNRTVFEGRLPADLEIKWNARLLTTAGLTHYRRDIPDDPYAPPIYSARVELSSKVLDCFAKLERTLCHELCHVAAWLVDHTAKPPHGPVFRKWADAAMGRYTHLDITTCHAYDIFYPFRWQCSNSSCLQSYGRHSNSIDVAKKVCGACRSPLTFLGRFKPDGTPAKQRAASPSKFSSFVKENHAQVRAQLPAGTPQSEVMRKLSERYAAQRQAGATSGAASSGADSYSGSFGTSLSAGVGQGVEGGDAVTSPLRNLTTLA